MEIEPKAEWFEAQKLEFTVDLSEAAKRQLQFLAAVDRNRYLYEGPVLLRAIYRYNACWLPLLAKHSESPLCKEKLVVPLDCEWIWHCHRLNPVQYKLDCEKLYGKILDNDSVVSSVQKVSKNQTEEIWEQMYPEEPYELDLERALSEDMKPSQGENFSEYDLVSAVARQTQFFYQVARSHTWNDLFLEDAVARYKGFIYLIKRNEERSIMSSCVPTYDIDLIWHTHQLHPVSYCKDLNGIVGKIIEHDDTDSDRTKGKKLHTGFSRTTQQFEEMFGKRYWKAGAMYRGLAPSSVTNSPCPFNVVEKKLNALDECQNLIQLPKLKVVEVLLEFVAVKNLPEGHEGSLFVSFSKKQPDIFFNTKRKLCISSLCGEKMVAFFQCEPTGELLFELVSPSTVPMANASKAMGSASLSLEELFEPTITGLSVQRWVKLVTDSDSMSTKPILLHVTVSFTIPTSAPRVLYMVRSQPFCQGSCFLPLHGKVQRVKGWTQIIDEVGNDVISLQMRDIINARAGGEIVSGKEVLSMKDSGEPYCLAKFDGNMWSIKDVSSSLTLQRKFGASGELFVLTGKRMVKLFPGRRLDYEPGCYEQRKNEQDFMTAVEFTSEEPYGRAVGLIDLRSGTLKVKDKWFVLFGIILAFILSEILKKEGYNGLMSKANLTLNMEVPIEDEDIKTTLTVTMGSDMEAPDAKIAKGDAMIIKDISKFVMGESDSYGYPYFEISGGCGTRCGTGCSKLIKNDSCGDGITCGIDTTMGSDMEEFDAEIAKGDAMIPEEIFDCVVGISGGCGTRCGSGCKNMINNGSCGDMTTYDCRKAGGVTTSGISCGHESGLASFCWAGCTKA